MRLFTFLALSQEPKLTLRLFSQIRELQLATSQVFGLLAGDALTSLASFVIALVYSWKLALVLFATLPISGIILYFITNKIEPAIQNQKRHLAVASKKATAALTAIDLVKTYNGYEEDLRNYNTSIELASKHYLTQAICNSIQIGYVSFWSIAMFVVGFWYGLALVNQGSQPGHIVTAFYATLAAFQSVEALMPQWLVLAKGMYAGAFLLDLLVDHRLDVTKVIATKSTPTNKPAGTIRVTDVSQALQNYFKFRNTSANLGDAGELLLSFQPRKTSFELCQSHLSRCQYHLRCWPKRLREEYSE